MFTHVLFFLKYWLYFSKSNISVSKFRFVWRAGLLPIFYMDPIRDKNVKWNNVQKCANTSTLWKPIFGARTTAAAAEEFPQSIQVPSSTHPGTTYPVRAIPHSDIRNFYRNLSGIVPNSLKHIFGHTAIFPWNIAMFKYFDMFNIFL